jgi:hypothetical protein
VAILIFIDLTDPEILWALSTGFSLHVSVAVARTARSEYDEHRFITSTRDRGGKHTSEIRDIYAALVKFQRLKSPVIHRESGGSFIISSAVV